MKKVFYSIFFIVLLVSIFFSVYYGCKWKQADNDLKDDVQIVVIKELNTKISSLEADLKEYMTKYADSANELVETKDKLAKNEEQTTQLQNEVTEKQNRIDTIEAEKTELQTQLSTAQSQLAESQGNNKELQNQVTTLTQRITALTEEKGTLELEVADKNSTIGTLTSEKNNLLSRISTLQTTLSENQTTIDNLNAQVLELQTQLASYAENYVPADTEKFAVVTFEYKDAFYGAQVIEKGSYAKIQEPTSTDRVTFNYWTYNNEEFNLETTPITQNMHLVADCSYKYEVKFVTVNDEGVQTVVDKQLINENACSAAPEAPIKDGYDFDYWTIDGVTEVDVSTMLITQDITFIAHFTKSIGSFAETSWSVISNVSVNGTAQEYFSVGDEKDIMLSTGEVITVVILGFNHDDLSDGNGKVGISIGMKNLLTDTYSMGKVSSPLGWSNTIMYTETLPMLYSELPLELQGVIKSVNKKTFLSGGDKTVVTTSNKLWLFTRAELNGNVGSFQKLLGSQYEYYNILQANDNVYFARKYLSNGEGNAFSYWFRTPDEVYSNQFSAHDSSGLNSSGSYSSAKGVCFGFCI